MSNKADALRIAQHVPVLPLFGKVPVISGGFKNASQDQAQVEQWWTHHPEAGIGVPTGSITGFDVLDVDGEEGLWSLKQYEAEHGPVPDTYVVITGRGCHYYLEHDPEMKNRAGFLPGLDVRGEGGYVVVPPSLHESGESYRWKGESPW
jgi:putative DNA primase/helicase